jgi:hypothetical protein
VNRKVVDVVEEELTEAMFYQRLLQRIVELDEVFVREDGEEKR